MFQPDRVAGAALSRDGAHVAFAVRDGRDVRFVIHDTNRADVTVRTAVDARPDTRLGCLRWAGNSLLLASTDEPALVAINARDGTFRRLFDVRSLPPAPRGSPRPTLRVLGLTADERSVLVEITSSGRDAGGPRVALTEVALDSYERHVLPVTPPTPAGTWMTDQQGNPRLWWSEGVLPRRWHLRAAGIEPTSWIPLDKASHGEPPLRSDLTPQNYLGERSIPLAFDFDPQVLYVASNVGRDTYGLYALDLRTGRRTGLDVEATGFDLVDLDAPAGTTSPLIFDRAKQSLAGVRRTGLVADTHWLDTELRETQAAVASRFPGREVHLLGWDDARTRFLLQVSSVSRPGRYFVYHRAEARLVEYSRQLDIDPAIASDVDTFDFTTEAGRRITGYLTLPETRGSARPPLVVWLHDGPCVRIAPEFQREAQALAAMGYAVLQVNYVGSAGLGRQAREGIRNALDTAPVADIVETLLRLAPQGHFDATRVVIGGHGFGGYLALRAVQLRPGLFRGAIALNAILDPARLAGSGETASAPGLQIPQTGPMTESPLRTQQTSEDGEVTDASAPAASAPPPISDSGSLMDGDVARSREPIDLRAAFAAWFFAPAHQQDVAVDAHLDQLSRPVLLGCDTRHPRADIDSVRALHTALTQRKRPATWVDLPASLERASPGERATLFWRIDRFLTPLLAEGAAP